MNLNIPTSTNDKFYFGNIDSEHIAYTLANVAHTHPGVILAIAKDSATARRIANEIPFFLDKKIPVALFPDRETLPYDQFSPHEDIISERLKILYHLPTQKTGIIIVAIQTLLNQLPPIKYITNHSLILKVGQQLNLQTKRQEFVHMGYSCVNQVFERGEFAVRGSILDVYPMGADLPFRIDLFDDEIDSIRTFDPQSQRSIKKLTSINLMPAKEFPLTSKAAETFRQNWLTSFADNTLDAPILKTISKQQAIAGIEYYLPLFFDNPTVNLLDYLPKDTLITQIHDTHTSATFHWQTILHRYEQLSHDSMRPILAPHMAFFEPNKIFARIKDFALLQIEKNHLAKTHKAKINFTHTLIPDIAIETKSKTPLAKLKTFLNDCPDNILFCAESAGRREILLEHLARIDINPKKINTWQEFVATEAKINILIAPLATGVILEENDQKFVIITENNIFANRILQERRRTKSSVNKDFNEGVIVRDLTELEIDAPIVHIDYGVGRYKGLQTLNVGEDIGEFLTLEYAKGDKLYIPITSLNLISRYSSGNIENAPLHKLGTDQWNKAVEKAAKRAQDVAAELLDIYALRLANNGFAYSEPNEDFQSFIDEFIFEETPGQLEASVQVIKDMINPTPMDRLLCGDVGFGKTEIAMRAAFLAAQNNKQVAMLVPTTLLAQQHFETFCDRFANWPIEIDVISRFKTAKEQKEAFAKIAVGQIDIIIGTHRLLSADIKFHDLGLLIIDEEHRFGVKHKEKIKSLRAQVDILTMSATPIPRTLNMSLSAIRDLSIIATPPPKRLSVKTFIKEYDDALICEAIMREVARGGQVYFLHNDVKSIDHKIEELQKILPNINFGIAHGQMRERQLEKVMSDFYHHHYNVLVCSTIIESGIDIPNANTIIINRADKLGLAQLHQLRGRVGRSHHQAYAYLLAPCLKLLTTDAQKRLDAMGSTKSLGAGFTLASHDLEIRGAGELLGDEQSGNIQTIGFGLYMELLDKTVKALKAGHTIDKVDFTKSLKVHGCEVDLNINTLIPENYLPDVHVRLGLYKRIANTTTQIELEDIQIEMIDRFGLLPEVTKNLFACTAIRHTADSLGIEKIIVNKEGGKLEFNKNPNINPQIIIKMVQLHPKTYQLKGPSKLAFTKEMLENTQRIAMVKKILGYLQECDCCKLNLGR